MHARDWFLVFISVFLPPVAVALKRGVFTKDTLLNLLLFLLGYFPGLIHALYIISKHPYPSHGGGLTRPNDGYGSLS
ncbi:Sna2p LALA0_S11e00518g [Lachancea lanzarotensis]|uniref:LALA0S11e00518g1_1 n=1 Tax=Lachancea lanzarotensis TaxID=1245769 RepID=A0A0C7ND24_9SACH|nr:uncharacterized protein LALA0_S11e00518g [Lachancea lanzarotensis]CEP64279.1 LALA0S11e00518g1_1 [Lachancea lanzarotensis]SCU95492.1 LAFA_0G00694g1_1 [Lachancea sp. 'fantastica']